MAKIDIARMKVGVDFEVNKSNLDAVQKEFDSLAVKAKVPGKEIDSGLKEAAQTASKVSDILEQCFNKKLNTLDVSKFSQELKKSGLNAESLRNSLAKGGIDGANAFNKLTQEILGTNIQLKKTSTFLDKMALTFANTVRFGISSAAFNGMTNSLSKAWDYTQKLDKSLNNIRIVSGQSAEQMRIFAKEANEASKKLGSTTLDYTNAALIYYQQGLPDDQIKERTDITIKMANALGSDAQQVSDYMTAIWNNFADGSKSLEYYADVITKLGAATASSAEEISGGLEKFAAVGQTIGLSYEYATAALTTITAQTRQSEDVVGTALKTIFSRIQGLSLGETLEDDTDLNKYSEALSKVGISIKDSNGELKDMDTILNEMGAKWGTLAKDQQVALAETVAGVRQYNQLVALMDNWDFMQENLDIARNSTGALSDQTEIYLESTEAHLNSLKASWERLYENLFSTSEINPAIDALTNIVTAVGKVSESFGGGAQSILGFGGMFVNVFQNQIDKALTHFISNSNIAKENLAALEIRSQFAKTAILESGPSAENQAEQAATEAQIENARRLEAVFSSISAQDAQRIINLQNQAVELEKQANLIDLMAEKEMADSLNESRNFGAFTEQDLLTIEEAGKELEDISDVITNIYDEHQIVVESIELEYEAIKGMLQDYDEEKSQLADIEAIQSRINSIISKSDSELINQLGTQSKSLKNEKLTADKKQEILKVIKKITDEERANTKQIEKNVRLAEKELKEKQKAKNIKSDASGVNQQIDAALKPLEKAQPLITTINTLTASISSLTATWSMFNSVTSIWADQDLSFGEKAIQTITSMSMAIPGLISAYKTLKTVQDTLVASRIASATAATEEAAANTAVAVSEEKVAVAEATEVATNEAQVAVEKAEVIAKTENVAATEANVVAETSSAVASTANTVAMGAETVATEAATAATWSFTAALMANPIIAVATVLLTAVGAIAAFTSASKKAREARIAENDAAYESADAAQKEAEAIERSSTAFLNAYDRYKEGTLSKKELAEVSDQLVEILGAEAVEVAKLTGNYDDLVNKLKETKKQAIGKQINEIENKKSSAASNMGEKAIDSSAGKREGKNYIKVSGSGNHGFSYDDELGDREFSQYLSDKGYTQYLYDYKVNEDGSYSWNTGIRTKDDAESMAELRELWDEYVKETTKEGSQYKVSSSEKADSEMYQAYKEFFESYSKDYDNYKKAQKELGEKKAQQEILNTDFSDEKYENYNNYKDQREKIAKALREADKDTYGEMSDEELNTLIDKQALSENKNLKDTLQRGGLQESILKDNLKDFSDKSGAESALAGLNKDELAALAGSGQDLTKLLAEMSDESMTLEDKLKALADKFGSADKSVISFNDALKEELKTLGVSESEFEEQVKQLKKLNPDLKDNEKQAKSIALANIKMNKGLSDLSDNFDDYSKALKNNKKGSAEYAKALDGMQKIMGNVLNIDGEALSDSFYTSAKNMELMKKAAEGDIQAIEDLRQAAGNDIIAHVQADTEEAKQALKDFDSVIDNINTKDLEIGATVDLGDGYAALNDFIAKSGMTADQVNAYLNSMGYQAEIETTKSKQMVHYSGVYPKLNDDGTITTIPWSTDVEEEVEVPSIKSLNYQGPAAKTVNFSNTKAGKSDNKKGGGGGSKKEKNKSDEKADRYQEVNKKLEMTSTLLSRLQDQEDKLLGKDLINNLNQQLDKLNSEIDLTKQKLKIAQGEQNEYANKLKNYGIQFNADGSINQQSYVNAFNAEQNRYNNAYTDDEAAKKRWEDFKEFISNYNELISTIDGLKDDIQKDLDKQLEINIRKFTLELEVRLDIKEASIKFNEFKRKIIDELSDDDIAGAVQQAFDNIKSVYSSKVIEELIEKINKEISEIGNPKVYGDNATKLLENLQEHYETLMDILIELDDYEQEIIDGYVDMLDHVSEEMDDQLSTYEQISSIIEHDMKLIQLTQGENAYNELKSYYERQTKVLNDSIDMRRRDMEFFAQQMATLEEAGRKDTEAWKNAEEAWKQATLDWQSAIEDAIEKLQEKLLNAINATFEKINEELTKNKGLEYLDQEWELINKNADKYLDSLNAAYGVQQLQNKYLDAINNNDSVLQQQKLQGLMNDELKALREKDKLSQYDLDRADLRYQIALKQIALEDAQQNKSKMRLRRDSQGNYSYQYTADDDQIAKTQQEISDLYNQLYNLDKNKYSDSLREIYDVWNEYQEKMAEAAQINDPEKRAERELLIQEQYSELLNNLAAENEELKFNLQESTFSELFDLYNINQDNYESMTNNQQIMLDAFFNDETNLQGAAYNNLFNLYDENVDRFRTMTEEERNILIGEMVPAWNSGIQEMVDTVVNDEGGFVPVMDRAFEEIKQATDDYKVDLDNLAESAGINFETIKDGIDSNIEATEKLLGDNKDLLDSYDKEVEAIGKVWDALDKLKLQYKQLAEEAKKAAEEGYKALNIKNEKTANEYAKDEVNSAKPTPTPTPAVTPVAPAPASRPTTPSAPSLTQGSYVKVKSGVRWYADSYGGGSSGPARNGSIRYINTRGSHPYNIDGLGWVRKTDIQGYRTGGYTGDWSGQDGRLAFLHQKELILNENDTKNMLAAVSILRDFNNDMLNRLSATGLGGLTGSKLEQNVHIDATFPNVTSANEIENALNNLVNVASQRINR